MYIQRRVRSVWSHGEKRKHWETWDFESCVEGASINTHPVRKFDGPLTSAMVGFHFSPANLFWNAFSVWLVSVQHSVRGACVGESFVLRKTYVVCSESQCALLLLMYREQRVVPLVQSGFHGQQHLLWRQMDRVRSRDSAYIPIGTLFSPRTGCPNPVRAVYHRTAREGDTALDLTANNARPQYFYETAPLLTPVSHSSAIPRPQSARSAPSTDTVYGDNARHNIADQLQTRIQHGQHGRSLYASKHSRPTSAPSVRGGHSATQSQRPWSASVATRAAVGIAPAQSPHIGVWRGKLHRADAQHTAAAMYDVDETSIDCAEDVAGILVGKGDVVTYAHTHTHV